jgi:alpha-L-fucosidase
MKSFQRKNLMAKTNSSGSPRLPGLFLILFLVVFSGLFLFLCSCHNQSSFSSDELLKEPVHYHRVQFIDPDDEEQAIIFKAAHVVPDQRQLAWQQKELMAFIHFGINTFTDREHGLGTESPELFNPTSFNPRQWTRVLKEAGFKTVILTAKHHDGFCLWPTRTTNHSVKKSKWLNGRGDVVREVARACREEGLDFGFYLSPWDTHEKSYGSEAYNEFFRRQLKELLTDYGPIAEVWFDGYCGEGPNGRRQVYDWNSYYELIRKLQPEAVIAIMGPDVRWVGNEDGLARETEWSVLPLNLPEPSLHALRKKVLNLENVFQPQDTMGGDLGSREKLLKARALFWYPAEVDVSIRPGWFYHQSQDQQVKKPEELFRIYFQSVGRNSVLLLNIPPDRRGLINENDVRALKEWKKLLDLTFKKNFALKARLRASSEQKEHQAAALVTPQEHDSWAPAENQSEASLEFFLEKSATFDCAELKEDVLKGQRVEEFSLAIWNNGTWQEVARGTTIGYKRLLTFPAVTTDRLRLHLKKFRATPYLKKFGLYKLAAGLN